EFQAGEVVSIRDLNGNEFARGIADFPSSDIKGKKDPNSEVIHRDNLVIL
ncbi:MAG: Glutamate 5-kinase, partial [Verrucomicrobiales bacterium]|nr:Glutamate 5-kinase [Verrucomicrobiales bacterium]